MRERKQNICFQLVRYQALCCSCLGWQQIDEANRRWFEVAFVELNISDLCGAKFGGYVGNDIRYAVYIAPKLKSWCI
jgi:hypothetical protein